MFHRDHCITKEELMTCMTCATKQYTNAKRDISGSGREPRASRNRMTRKRITRSATCAHASRPVSLGFPFRKHKSTQVNTLKHSLPQLNGMRYTQELLLI